MSRYFLPTLKETPAEAQIASHRLMLRAGMIRQLGAGIYAFLPLAVRVMNKIEAIVRAEQERFGAHEVILPTIQQADLWRESGRYADYGKEMLRIADRHEREMLYGPTAEEAITDVFRHAVHSYRQLPQMLYQIHWKFRDEIRPRFGVMRGREFLMKDGYSFDLDAEASRRAYERMFVAYLNSFARMGLTAIPLRAETGPIGGDLSHEFCVLAQTGETELYCDRRLLDIDVLGRDLGPESDIPGVVEEFTQYYAATDDIHEPGNCPLPESDLVVRRGIEVGHIFHFGTKYAEPMNAYVTNEKGESVPVQMGSYGIGISRLLGAIIEAGHDDKGIIWPDPVAPFQVALINLAPGNPACDSVAEGLYGNLKAAGVEVLHEDRDLRAGQKFAEMDLIGLPWRVVVGPRGAEAGRVELGRRDSGESEELAPDSVLARLAA